MDDSYCCLLHFFFLIFLNGSLLHVLLVNHCFRWLIMLVSYFFTIVILHFEMTFRNLSWRFGLFQACPYDSLKDVALKILQNEVATVPIIHSSSQDGLFPQLLHLASLSGILKCKPYTFYLPMVMAAWHFCSTIFTISIFSHLMCA